MATVGYYLRTNAVRAADTTFVCGDRWALIRMDERYNEEIVAEGLSYEDAAALYWRKLEELTAPAAHPAGDAGVVERKPPRRSPHQLVFRF